MGSQGTAKVALTLHTPAMAVTTGSEGTEQFSKVNMDAAVIFSHSLDRVDYHQNIVVTDLGSATTTTRQHH